MRSLGLVSLGALALTVTCCKTPPPVPALRGPDGQVIAPPPKATTADEEQATRLAALADSLAAKDKAGAEAKRDELVDLYPGTAVAARILYERGRAAEAQGELGRAVLAFEKLLFFRPSFERADEVRERYATLLVRLERFEDAANMLRALYSAAKAAPDQERLGLALASALTNAHKLALAVDVCIALYNLPGIGAEARAACATRAVEIATSRMSFKEAQDLWDDIGGDSASAFLQAALAFKLAKLHYHTRDFDRSEKMLKAVSTRFADTLYGEQARDLLRRLRDRNTVEANKIGVVLPLSGRYQQYGARALEAIKLAFASAPNLKLVVKDSAGDPPAAARAVEELVLLDHVIAVIGPLFSTEAWAAALKCEELSVPLVALSHREGLPEVGPYVFRTALTVKAQAIALATVAFEELGMRRFALLYPRSQYGKEFVQAFWDEVERRKGEIRGAESYEHDQTTFQEPVRKLVGHYFWLAREDYREALRQIRAQKLPPHRQQMALEKIEKELAPIVDFDAVVIPDSGKNLGLIAPALAVEDVVLTRDSKEIEKIKKATGRKEVHPVTLLGGSTWNAAQTVESCERYCENAVFVDGYYADSPDTKVRDFVTGFRDKTSAEPNLSEAQAFDAAGLVRHVLQTSRPTDRKAFREALAELKGYEGVTGFIRFDAVGDTLKKLLVLTIQEGVIRLWQPDTTPAQG